METIDLVKEVLPKITYKAGWEFRINKACDGYSLYVNPTEFPSRLKYINTWYMKENFSAAEIVRTAYKATRELETALILEQIDSTLLGISGSRTIEEVADRFEYKNWNLLYDRKPDGILLWLTFDAPDTHNPEKIELQVCRTWILPKECVYSDIKAIVVAAIINAEEHEMNEQFRYNGKIIYNPHIESL